MKEFFKRLWAKTVRAAKIVGVSTVEIVKKALTSSIQTVIQDMTKLAIEEVKNFSLAEIKVYKDNPIALKLKLANLIDKAGDVLEKEQDVVLNAVFIETKKVLVEEVQKLNE